MLLYAILGIVTVNLILNMYFYFKLTNVIRIIMSNCEELLEGLIEPIDTNDDHQTEHKRERLAALVLGGQAKQYLGKNVSAEDTELRAVDWNNVMMNGNAQNSYTLFHNAFKELYNECFPLKLSKSLYRKRLKWLTPGLKISIKHKNKLYIKSLKFPTPNNQNAYKLYKRKLHSLLQKCERNYFDRAFAQNRHNLRKSWNLINSALNKKRLSNAQHTFCINGEMVNDGQIIANKFNKYFVNVGPTLSKSISASNESPLAFMKSPNTHSIFVRNTTDIEVMNIINALKHTSPGYDDISSKVVKSSVQYILRPLVHIFNLSLSQGIVPKELKIARVTPVYKSGDKANISNYRPISVLPCFSKILERLMHNRLMQFIKKHQILHENQYGFRENHSTNLALSYLIDKIVMEYEKGNSVLGIFIDFSKAFDTINHAILLKKLHNCGIRGVALKWIQDYLSNRSQFVHFNNFSSNVESIRCGVPQGSILGPLLFLLYVNDIVNISSRLFSVLFADDTNMFISGRNIDEMIDVMNNELVRLVTWLNANRLSLNVNKTHYVIFRPGNSVIESHVNLYINNQLLNRENSTKFLGVVIDSKLSFCQHIQHIKMKVAKNIGVLCKAKKIFQRSTVMALYYSFIYPYMSYCIEVWGSAANKYTESLLKLQKLCCRIISGSPPRTSSGPLFELLKIMRVSDIYEYCVLILMYKFYTGKLPRTFNTFFKMSERVFNTRQINLMHVPICKSQTAYRSIRFSGVKLWNNYSPKLSLPCSLNEFKSSIKKRIFEKYSCEI